jgi:hypothetical protein
MTETVQPARLSRRAAPIDLNPVFILTPPLCSSSLLGTMLGQHPDLYGLPETHLFPFETMADWWTECSKATYDMSHGLLRAVAQIEYGEQTEAAVTLAGGWLRRRKYLTTGALLEELAERAYPRVLVDKSPSIAAHIEAMWRAFAMFPQARFVHILRHPRAFCEAVMEAIQEAAVHGLAPAWLINLASTQPPPPLPGEEPDEPLPTGMRDPQWSWYILNRNIMDFLSGVPANQNFRLRVEDVLTDPDAALRPLCSWLGVQDSPEAIDEMKHPERSPFACFGPLNATYGDDPAFLRSPTLPAGQPEVKSLEGPLPWRGDDRGFAPAVSRLAEELGYR